MTESENENDQNDLDHFDHILTTQSYLVMTFFPPFITTPR